MALADRAGGVRVPHLPLLHGERCGRATRRSTHAPQTPALFAPRTGMGVETSDNRAAHGGSGSAYPPGNGDRAARAREDRRLLERYHRHGDAAAREALVERFLPLARQLARRYQRGGEPLDDLVQVASLGLLKAIDRFEPDRPT